MARVPKRRQVRQAKSKSKSKRENRYVIKVMRLNREGGAVPLARENQITKGCTRQQAFSLVVNVVT